MGLLFAIIWVVLTALIEVWVAMKYGYEEKNHLVVVATVNIITHAIVCYWIYDIVSSLKMGSVGILLIMIYVLCGFVEIFIERPIYKKCFDYYTATSYIDEMTLTDCLKVANIASYVLGIFIAAFLGAVLGL